MGRRRAWLSCTLRWSVFLLMAENRRTISGTVLLITCSSPLACFGVGNGPRVMLETVACRMGKSAFSPASFGS